MGLMRLLLSLLCLWLIPVSHTVAQSYPAPKPTESIFDVPDVSKANVLLTIFSVKGEAIYTLQCHSAGYTGDPDFEYSGDFECRLSFAEKRNRYSTLLTEDPHQSRDWESRGRFFAADLRGDCSRIPEFGADRTFRLRGMRLTLHVINPSFRDGKLASLKLAVGVKADPQARRQIAEIVPLPKAGAPAHCKLSEYFVDQ